MTPPRWIPCARTGEPPCEPVAEPLATRAVRDADGTIEVPIDG